ncbi:MAG: hypothetical protein WD972_01865 [Candidatus Andersenbacteria bacterium]
MYIDDDELSAEGLPGHIAISLSDEEIDLLKSGEALKATAEETGIGVTIASRKSSIATLTKVTQDHLRTHSSDIELRLAAARVRQGYG